jgi:hypothetical protein
MYLGMYIATHLHTACLDWLQAVHERFKVRLNMTI